MNYEKVIVLIDLLVRLCGRVLSQPVQRDEDCDKREQVHESR